MQPRAALPGTPEGTAGVSARSLNQPGLQSRVRRTDGTFWNGKGSGTPNCCIEGLRGSDVGVQKGFYLPEVM